MPHTCQQRGVETPFRYAEAYQKFPGEHNDESPTQYALSVLPVQKYLIRGISEFNSKVIVKFARQKNRRIDFIYKITREQAV